VNSKVFHDENAKDGIGQIAGKKALGLLYQYKYSHTPTLVDTLLHLLIYNCLRTSDGEIDAMASRCHLPRSKVIRNDAGG
jgi:hypothetical protein